jgi:hypothetical protein
MSDNRTDLPTQPSTVAITQDENRLKAVELRGRIGALELLWAKSSDSGQTTWAEFATACGISSQPTGQRQSSSRTIIAGYDSARVAFYRIDVPDVKEEEIAAMVRLQAEAQVPLPANQMQIAWRAGSPEDGQVPITIAAARTDYLQAFVEDVRSFEPARILLHCEAIVEVWRVFFGGSNTRAVIVNVGQRNTQICFAERGRLSKAVGLDMGIGDFPSSGRSIEKTEIAERFTQDMTSVLESFGEHQPGTLPIFVLSDGSTRYKRVASCLASAGLNASAALPQAKKLRTQVELAAKDLYEYRVPIGLALMALDGEREQLDIFEQIYSPAQEAKKSWLLSSPKVAAVIAAVMLAVLVAVLYASDVASERRLSRLGANADFQSLLQRQKLMKAVASERPDLLELLSQISSAESSGIMLDSFYFKKGQLVSITGQAQGADQLYKFEKSLENINGIKDVHRTSTSRDAKTKKFEFTMTFSYKNFTRNKTPSSARVGRLYGL